MQTNAITDAWFHRLKAATRDLVKHCGGVVRAGEIAHVSKSEISRLQSATDPDIISIPQALSLEADCGLPLVTTVMADLHGRRLSDPVAEGREAASVFGRAATAVRAAGEMMAGIAVAQADGEMTAAEAETLDRLAGDVERALGDFRQGVAEIKAGASLRPIRGGRG